MVISGISFSMVFGNMTMSLYLLDARKLCNVSGI